MSMLIDQTWVPAWVEGRPDGAQLATLAGWLKEQPAHRRGLLIQFPPLSLVRSQKWLEVPFQFTVGIVGGYEDGSLLVQQGPQMPYVRVPVEDLECAGYWKGLGPNVVQQVLGGAQLSL